MPADSARIAGHFGQGRDEEEFELTKDLPILEKQVLPAGNPFQYGSGELCRPSQFDGDPNVVFRVAGDEVLDPELSVHPRRVEAALQCRRQRHDRAIECDRVRSPRATSSCR